MQHEKKKIMRYRGLRGYGYGRNCHMKVDSERGRVWWESLVKLGGGGGYLPSRVVSS